LERQHLSHAYLAHHELESTFTIIDPSNLHCRHLDKQDFTVFLQRYCLLSDTKLSEIADDMITKLSQPDKQSETTSDDAMQLQLEALSAHQVC